MSLVLSLVSAAGLGAVMGGPMAAKHRMLAQTVRLAAEKYALDIDRIAAQTQDCGARAQKVQSIQWPSKAGTAFLRQVSQEMTSNSQLVQELYDAASTVREAGEAMAQRLEAKAALIDFAVNAVEGAARAAENALEDGAELVHALQDRAFQAAQQRLEDELSDPSVHLIESTLVD